MPRENLVQLFRGEVGKTTAQERHSAPHVLNWRMSMGWRMNGIRLLGLGAAASHLPATLISLPVGAASRSRILPGFADSSRGRDSRLGPRICMPWRDLTYGAQR